MSGEKHWTTHLEFAVLLITLIGGFYLLDGKIERQGARTDRLYEMFVDLIKETKK
jgi:hypothetical protein